MTRVVHCQKQPYDIYIGRPSKFGNPFEIGKDGNRVEVIEKYEAWLRQHPNLVLAAIKELKGKVLGCFCAPSSCHGDILARYAENSEDYLRFFCRECGYNIIISRYEDPTTSTGSCLCCGGSNWVIYDLTGKLV